MIWYHVALGVLAVGAVLAAARLMLDDDCPYVHRGPEPRTPRSDRHDDEA